MGKRRKELSPVEEMYAKIAMPNGIQMIALFFSATRKNKMKPQALFT